MRLIDADALGVGRCSRDLLPAAYCAGWNGLVNLIEDAPTIDAVPVVRCKNCKHRGSDMCPMETVELYPWFGSKNDAFCSYGEKRDE